VAHKIYGIPQTINSANYVYFLALSELHKLTDHSRGEGTKRTRKDLEQIVIGGWLAYILVLNTTEPRHIDELLNLHRGQGLELLWRDSLTCPTEEEYVEMVNNKTGGLFRIAIKLMMAESESDVDYTPLVNLIGVLFQIRDDYMNLQSDEYTVNKSFAEDLTEGKFSFPIVHAVRTESGRQVLNVLQKRPSTPTMKSYIISHMETETHSFEYVRSVLSILERQAMTEISRLGGNPQLEAIVSLLSVPPAGPQS
jgi:geranylgeranyl diphosphate synthase type 3